MINLNTKAIMIVNFEEITYELDLYETEVLLPLVIEGLTPKIGKGKAVSSSEICYKMKARGYKMNDARLRKIVHHIRVNNLIRGLIATSKGYYISNDLDELKTYSLSLKQRESSIRDVRNSIDSYIMDLT